jgi:subtilisin family serine protease
LRTPRLGRLLALSVIAAAVTAVPGVATAAPSASAPVPTASVARSAPATITLVTGDTVTFAKDAAGRASVDVTPRSDSGTLTYTTQQDKGGYYLIPEDAAPLVSAGLVDRQLFNLDYLAANGYTDDAAKTVPLIVQYQQQLSATDLEHRATADPVALGRGLPSVNGAALEVAKDQTGAFWNRLRGSAARSAQAPAALGEGVAKVWLDAKVKALDDVSNVQIGAPDAWAAGHDGTGATVGIIDTGVDRTHPDLAGQIVEARNFVEAGFPGGGAPEDVTDRHGHGTHVASTVAGSGAASGGRYEGVAPGAKLVIAKALDDSGSGTNSAIIAAMEWEAQRVDVVSMSLGGGPTDGTDPLSTAVNQLTARYGTLFVIAAGNSGPGSFTVAAPGAADAALTVGAVDSDDKIADFSSRGPRVGDLAIKPEITAPGVGIVAARAEGTKLGTPLNDDYTAASGTSMATPHVAAAAGILAAAHQDWTPDQLKAALTSTSHDVGVSVYDQGAGRLDIGHAATGGVTVDDVAAISAKVAYPYEGQAVTKTVTFRNTGSSPVTLDVSAKLTHDDGAPAPDAMATVDKPSVTVEPGATASVALTLDPTVADPGWYEGLLTATDGANQLTVPIALWLQAEQQTVRLQLIGDPTWFQLTSLTVDAVLLNDTDPRFAGEPTTRVAQWRAGSEPGTRETTISLARGGIYSVGTSLFWAKADRQLQFGMVVEPEVSVDGDQLIVLDATKLTPVNITTEQPSDPVMSSFFYYRSAASGQFYTGGSVLSNSIIAAGRYWISPTAKPTIGKQGFIADETRIAPQVSLSAPGFSLHPRYITDRMEFVPKFTEDRRVGFANEQDLRAGKDVRGKLVFLTTAPLETFKSDLTRAIAGGAAGVLTNNHLAWIMHGSVYADYMKIPLLWVDSAEAAVLAKRLPKSAALNAELSDPYEYKAVYYLRDRIPSTINLGTRDKDLAKVDTTYHSRYAPNQGEYGPVAAFTEVQHTFIPDQPLSVRGSHEFVGPTSRTEYYTVPGDDVLWARDYLFQHLPTQSGRAASSQRGFTRGSRGTENWNQPVLPMQTLAGPDVPTTGQSLFICDNCRQGDRLRLRSLGGLGLGLFADASDPSHKYQNEAGTEEIRLYRNGAEVTPEHDAYGLPYYTVPTDSATYRLSDVYTNGFPGPHGAGTVTTDWTFRSGRPAKATVAQPYACIDGALFNDTQPCAWQPLIQLSYGFDLAQDDTTKAGRPFTFTVTPRIGTKQVALRDLRVWISADGGKHWLRTAVHRAKDGTYQASIMNPRGAGPVAVRTEATDRDGNSVSQTVLDAYLVR